MFRATLLRLLVARRHLHHLVNSHPRPQTAALPLQPVLPEPRLPLLANTELHLLQATWTRTPLIGKFPPDVFRRSVLTSGVQGCVRIRCQLPAIQGMAGTAAATIRGVLRTGWIHAGCDLRVAWCFGDAERPRICTTSERASSSPASSRVICLALVFYA